LSAPRFAQSPGVLAERITEHQTSVRSVEMVEKRGSTDYPEPLVSPHRAATNSENKLREPAVRLRLREIADQPKNTEPRQSNKAPVNLENDTERASSPGRLQVPSGSEEEDRRPIAGAKTPGPAHPEKYVTVRNIAGEDEKQNAIGHDSLKSEMEHPAIRTLTFEDRMTKVEEDISNKTKRGVETRPTPSAPVEEERTEIHISIGSIELRAPRTEARTPAAPFRPHVTLSEFLRRKPEAGA
jgi:hypothetical protein